MDLAVSAARIVRGHQRHVTIGALLSLRRIVERAGALARNPRCLPVVVFVEAAKPPVAVDRNVQMDLVTRRAELGGLVRVERLQKGLAMRQGSGSQKIIVGPSE